MITRPRHRHGDRGAITVWTLGMIIVVGFFGWMTIDLYSAFGDRRELAAAADQAAQAGATALDAAAWRNNGVRQLDPDRAEQIALQNLGQQDLGPLANVTVTATTEQVTVILEADVASGLISIFRVGDDNALHVKVTATGTPQQDTP